MKFKVIYYLFGVLTFLFMSSCVRNYTCSCSNPGGVFDEKKVSGNKVQAQKKCQQYYENKYGSIPWNETYCEVK